MAGAVVDRDPGGSAGRVLDGVREGFLNHPIRGQLDVDGLRQALAVLGQFDGLAGDAGLFDQAGNTVEARRTVGERVVAGRLKGVKTRPKALTRLFMTASVGQPARWYSLISPPRT
ncbi:hypothetical protein ACIBQ1_54870 [Nonomuraea sp. NPDC050153]|uniref:hypothetical protein n=1 Tax=Nonomuraea sp. NPDC050153 TaxID=3364359 RepID=UPI00379EFDFA